MHSVPLALSLSLARSLSLSRSRSLSLSRSLSGEPLKVNEYELRVEELGMKDVTLLTCKEPGITVRASLSQSVALLYASCAGVCVGVFDS